MIRTLLFVLTVVTIASAQGHTWATVTTLALGGQGSTSFSPFYLNEPLYFVFKTFSDNAAWSTEYNVVNGNANFSVTTTNSEGAFASQSPCVVKAGNGSLVDVTYIATGNGIDNVTLWKIANQDTSELTIGQTIRIRRITWSNNFFELPQNLPSAPLYQYYRVTAKTSYESVSVRLVLYNEFGSPREWSMYFISVTVGSFDANCNLVGEEIDLQNSANNTATSIERTSLPLLNVAENDTIHFRFLLNNHRAWFTQEEQIYYRFEAQFVVPTAPTSPAIPAMPTAPTAPTALTPTGSSTATGWAIALGVLAVFAAAGIVVAVFIFLRMRGNYESVS